MIFRPVYDTCCYSTICKRACIYKNIGHIRLQESDRIHAIVTELERLGVRVEEEQDAVKIYPSDVKPAVVQTYDDHRMAMSFALIGLKVDGIVIDNYECCKKHLKIILMFWKV